MSCAAAAGKYLLSVATSGADALEIANGSDRPDLVLLDIMMPEMDGYEVCLRLKADATTQDIPVIFITAMSEVEDETKGFSLGAVDYITKPIRPSIVKARVAAHLELALARKTLAAQNKILNDSLAMAADVQRSLVPNAPPCLPGRQVAGRMIPCEAVGGDYLDFLSGDEFSGRGLGIAVGDVSGHGPAAALLMTAARACLRMRAAHPGNLGEVVTDMNQHMVADLGGAERFMTFYLLEVRSDSVSWVSAGHEPALLHDPAQGVFTDLKGDGPFLGMDADIAFCEHRAMFNSPGQLLALFTDGISRRGNSNEDLESPRRQAMSKAASCSLLAFLVVASSLPAAESLWIEAEHLDGVRGACWPMGRPDMQKTDGNWGLSGPGWAAEWNMGGESGFLSIATGADDDRAAVTKNVEIPATGNYQLWVRYGDWRERTERFQVQIEQGGLASWTGTFGERPIVDEDNEMKLYWGWVFAWDRRSVPLTKGPAKITLRSTTKEAQPRQVDVLVLTTDAGYQPRIKDRPHRYSWDVLDAYRGGGLTKLEGLARNPGPAELPPAWKLRTFRNKGFLYLWNVSHTKPEESWLGDQPDRVPVPYNIIDVETRAEFEKMYAGRSDVPIFSDPRIVPTFHGVGAGIFATDPKTGEVLDAGKRFARWLDAHPDRCWAMMMNYHPGAPIGEQGQQLLARYRDRYVGSISGESLGYFYPQAEEMRQATVNARTRRQLVEAFTPLTLRLNADKYRAVYGQDLDRNPYEDVIACLAVGNIAFTPLCYQWGARTAGYESSAMTSSLLAMRWAFLRGAARQNEGLTATYRSCNFGDAATIFSIGGSYHAPQNIIENYYSVYSGAGMTWYKMDIWYQYMAGSSMFYHEQGFDEFWCPGGTGTGTRPVQLSPKGKLVDRFLRLTAAQPDRGDPYTPVALLVDYAHGWEPAPFWPNSFKNWHEHQDRFRYGDHERMLEEYFWTAYHPIGPESEKPITALNEVYLPGVFGDIFDVIFAYPDTNRWRTMDTYPVVIAAGEIELTALEGQRLAQYVTNGGTLLVADGHLTGPGLTALNLPAAGGSAEAYGYCWLEDSTVQPSQLFRFRPIDAKGGRELARTPDGKCFCASLDRGRGRLIYLSVPYGLGIDRQAIPVVAHLVAHLTRGLMPVEVSGDVQWLVNRSAGSWLVTLLNPAGQLKPQQGVHPTDFRENRTVTIRSRSSLRAARDRLLPDDRLQVEQNSVRCEVQAGGVRIIELN